jgi:hypothetical protein
MTGFKKYLTENKGNKEIKKEIKKKENELKKAKELVEKIEKEIDKMKISQFKKGDIKSMKKDIKSEDFYNPEYRMDRKEVIINYTREFFSSDFIVVHLTRKEAEKNFEIDFIDYNDKEWSDLIKEIKIK